MKLMLITNSNKLRGHKKLIFNEGYLNIKEIKLLKPTYSTVKKYLPYYSMSIKCQSVRQIRQKDIHKYFILWGNITFVK